MRERRSARVLPRVLFIDLRDLWQRIWGAILDRR